MDKNKLKNKLIDAGQKALVATGIFAIFQEIFSGYASGSSIFAMIIFVGLFLLTFFRRKN